jgi:hypothetical protein
MRSAFQPGTAIAIEGARSRSKMTHPLVRYSPEMEGSDAYLAEPPPGTIASRRAASRAASVFGEGRLLELAAETLECRCPTALDPMLDRLIGQASRVLGKPLAAPLARPLKDVLRRVARDALPSVAGAPGRAAAADAQPLARAARLLGLELEGLSPEDKEFELAKGFVRLVGEAVRHATAASGAGPAGASPPAPAVRAVALAARHAAPGLRLDPAASRRERTPTAAQPGKERTMHDFDRTQAEYAGEFPGFQGEQFEYGESEWSPESGGTFSESEEMELAAELLGVGSEAELDRFLGDLVSRATKAVGSFVRSPIGQAVGGVLKGVAKKALPMAGAAVGGYFGGPLGAKIGSGLANAAGGALGLEAEMSGEDREFEGAKQFVRLAAQTAANAAAAPPGSDPRAVAQQAAVAAARQLAPGLLSGGAGMAPSSGGQRTPQATGGAGVPRSGRWLRRGGKIVLYGV